MGNDSALVALILVLAWYLRGQARCLQSIHYHYCSSWSRWGCYSTFRLSAPSVLPMSRLESMTHV